MSDEKLSALDGRVAQLVTMTGKLIETVTTLTEQEDEFSEEQKMTSSRLHEALKAILKKNKTQEEFEAQQRVTSEQLDNELKAILKRNEQEEFRCETNDNFVKLREENKVINRKVEWATTTSLDADKRVEALEIRVAELEQKIAA
jgi:hypothetical protein